MRKRKREEGKVKWQENGNRELDLIYGFFLEEMNNNNEFWEWLFLEFD
jgi:ribosome biogenesis protein Nip4